MHKQQKFCLRINVHFIHIFSRFYVSLCRKKHQGTELIWPRLFETPDNKKCRWHGRKTEKHYSHVVTKYT